MLHLGSFIFFCYRGEKVIICCGIYHFITAVSIILGMCHGSVLFTQNPLKPHLCCCIASWQGFIGTLLEAHEHQEHFSLKFQVELIPLCLILHHLGQIWFISFIFCFQLILQTFWFLNGFRERGKN